MPTYPPLETLGKRIMIVGPSNSGKSTLARAIGNRLDIPAIHIDLLRHLPNTDWQERPTAEFHALHDHAILAPAWVMEGNYSSIMPQRFDRATGVIILDDHHLPRLARYFRRTLFQRDRAGGLDGNRDSIKWQMIDWIWTRRHSVKKYREMTARSGLPNVNCASFSEVKALYKAWAL